MRESSGWAIGSHGALVWDATRGAGPGAGFGAADRSCRSTDAFCASSEARMAARTRSACARGSANSTIETSQITSVLSAHGSETARQIFPYPEALAQFEM